VASPFPSPCAGLGDLAGLDQLRIDRNLDRFERVLAREPSAALITQYAGLLWERQELAPEPGGDRDALPPPGGSRSAAAERARERYENAGRDLLRQPSVEAVRELRDAWAGLRAQERPLPRRRASRHWQSGRLRRSCRIA
jgi:hypothetical protein